MHIHVSWYTIPKQVAWSVIYCPHCQQLEAGRCDEHIQITEIYFIPVSREVSGQGGRCDFCERPASEWMSENTVPLDAWSPAQGLPTLLSLVDMPAATIVPPAESESRLHSLLYAIEEKCAINGMDVRLGLVLGGAIGAGGGGAICALMTQRGFRVGELDALGSIFAAILAGGLAGVILGGCIQILLTRHRIATRCLRESCGRYRIDLKKLQEIAMTHSAMIRRAVRRLRDSLSISR